MDTNKMKVLDEVAVDGASLAKFVKDYDHLLLEVITTGFTGKLFTVGSFNDGDDIPDFNSASGLDNAWGYVQIKDLEDGTGKDGADGITFTSSTAVGLYEVNTNRLAWLGSLIDDYSAGTISVKLVGIIAH